MTLWQHQLDGVARIRADDGIHGLLWQPGAGKSATVIRYLEELAAELGRTVRVLIVVPKSVLGVWPGEFEKHCTVGWDCQVLDGTLSDRFAKMALPLPVEWPPEVDATVVAYSTFSAKPRFKDALKAVTEAEFDVIVLDEAHNIRGAQSNTSKALGKIGKLIPRRLLLTGTPTPHGPEDVYGQWRFLHPEVFSPPGGAMVSYSRWLSEYAIFGGFQGRQIVGWRDMDDMQERISRKSSVVLTEDCHDLEPLTVQRIRFPLSPAEASSYLEMRRDLLTVVEDETISVQSKLVSILRLRQITSGFLPSEETGGYLEIGRTRRELALGLLSDLAASEKRLLVFAWSRHEIDALIAELRANPPWGSEVFRIAGDTKNREEILKQFSSNAPQRMILVAQVTTLSSGTNALVGASQVLYLSLSQRADEWTQSLCRVHRPGQDRPVTARVLVAENTVDELILDALEGRVEFQTTLLEHIKSG